jgi:opacity protein-like surface antigen
MKKLLLLSSALLVLTASAASAQVNLSWNNCIGVGTAAMNMNYACDGSGAIHKAVMSWKNPVGMAEFVGIQAVVDIQTSSPVLPDFWRRGSLECAEGNVDFPASLSGIGGAGVCNNVWAGGLTGGGYEYQSGFGGPGRARVRLAFSRDTPVATAYGANYLAGVINMLTTKDIDTGLGVCDGCQIPGCLVLNSVELFAVAGAPVEEYTMHLPDQRNWITWQGGDPSCVGATPTHNRTWGSVKSLYR